MVTCIEMLFWDSTVLAMIWSMDEGTMRSKIRLDWIRSNLVVHNLRRIMHLCGSAIHRPTKSEEPCSSNHHLCRVHTAECVGARGVD